MGRTHKRKVRTPEERKQFYKSAKTFGGEETEQSINALTLDGSDDSQISIKYDDQQEVKKPSLRSWLSLHLREIIITAIIIPAIYSGIKWIIDVKAEQKYLNRTIEEIRLQIEQLDKQTNDYSVFVTKENLELKLEILERDIKAVMPDFTAIESKLSHIENEIEELKNAS